MTSKFYSLPLRSDGVIHFEPRELFDSAIIGFEGMQIVYDENQLIEIVANDYERTIRLLVKYKLLTDDEIKIKCHQLAVQWIFTMRYSSIYGSTYRRPIIRRVDEQS